MFVRKKRTILRVRNTRATQLIRGGTWRPAINPHRRKELPNPREITTFVMVGSNACRSAGQGKEIFPKNLPAAQRSTLPLPRDSRRSVGDQVSASSSEEAPRGIGVIDGVYPV
jgi:hypothetical protein